MLIYFSFFLRHHILCRKQVYPIAIYLQNADKGQKAIFVKCCSYGGELARLGGLANLGEISDYTNADLKIYQDSRLPKKMIC